MSYKDLFITSNPSISNIKKGKEHIIDVLGVPFDSTSTFRTGSRFGPNAIREALQNIEVYSSQLDVDIEDLCMKDLGNLNQTINAKHMSDVVEKVVSEIISEGYTPAVLGGEHSISYGTFKAAPKDSALILFDAHGDVRDEFADVTFSHTTWLRRLIEERSGKNIMHIGLRASTREEILYLTKERIKTIPTKTILTTDKSEKTLKDFLSDFDSVYVSVDMDVLDPAYAPGVGNPEVAGISTSKLLDFLHILKGKKICGFDIVEVTPQYDNGISAIAAAKIMVELICLTHLGENK